MTEVSSKNNYLEDMMNEEKLSKQNEVLNPWADVDPVPLRVPSPRLPDLGGKTIGLFATDAKVAARPILDVVEQKLRERIPSLKFSWFLFSFNQSIAETADNARFEEWVKEIDAAVAAVGD
jgi:hypothetical protein